MLYNFDIAIRKYNGKKALTNRLIVEIRWFQMTNKEPDCRYSCDNRCRTLLPYRIDELPDEKQMTTAVIKQLASVRDSVNIIKLHCHEAIFIHFTLITFFLFLYLFWASQSCGKCYRRGPKP